MVCVAVKGRPIIGVIHQPFDDHSTSSWVWVQHGMSADLKYPKISDKKVIVFLSLQVYKNNK